MGDNAIYLTQFTHLHHQVLQRESKLIKKHMSTTASAAMSITTRHFSVQQQFFKI